MSAVAKRTVTKLPNFNSMPLLAPADLIARATEERYSGWITTISPKGAAKKAKVVRGKNKR